MKKVTIIFAVVGGPIAQCVSPVSRGLDVIFASEVYALDLAVVEDFGLSDPGHHL